VWQGRYSVTCSLWWAGHVAKPFVQWRHAARTPLISIWSVHSALVASSAGSTHPKPVSYSSGIDISWLYTFASCARLLQGED